MSDLDSITAEIKFYLGRITQDFIEVGTRLILAKEQLPHGAWRGWLADNFNLSQDTAQNLMSVAKRFGSKTETFRIFGYSRLTVLAKVQDVDAFIAENPAAASMPVRDLKAAVKRWRSTPETITADAVITSTEIIETPRFLQPALFPLEPVPAAFNFHLPRDVIAAAHKIPAPCSIVRRRADFDNTVKGVVVAFAGISDLPLILARASALIPLPVRLTFTDGDCARRRNCLILFTGDNVHAFADAFKVFGAVTVPYKRKSSDASNARALS